MKNAASTPALDFRLKAFLCAPVDESAAAEPLSVVSALARLDLDPWGEAAELSRLPRDAAAQRLTGHLERVADKPAVPADISHAIDRLMALLPRGLDSQTITRATPPVGGASVVGASKESPDVMIVCLIVSAVSMMTFAFMTSQHAPPGQGVSDRVGAPSPSHSPGQPSTKAAAASGADATTAP